VVRKTTLLIFTSFTYRININGGLHLTTSLDSPTGISGLELRLISSTTCRKLSWLISRILERIVCYLTREADETLLFTWCQYLQRTVLHKFLALWWVSFSWHKNVQRNRMLVTMTSQVIQIRKCSGFRCYHIVSSSCWTATAPFCFLKCIGQHSTHYGQQNPFFTFV
jgi:hypothetical protein